MGLSLLAAPDDNERPNGHRTQSRLLSAMSTTAVPRPRHVDIMYAIMTAELIDRADTVPAGIESLLRHNGASKDLMGLLQGRPFAQVMLERAQLDMAAQANINARSAALTLAARHDGIVVDLGIPRLVEPPVRPLNIATANQWVLVHYDHIDAGFISTRGLESFGLPELRVQIPDGAQPTMCGAVTSGITHRLLVEWPTHDPIGPAVITLRDIAHGLGDECADDVSTERQVNISLSYDDELHELVATIDSDPLALFR